MLLSAHRTRGPWEPEWIAGVRLAYYSRRVALERLIGRIGRTDSGRAFLRRTGAYGWRDR